MTAKDQEIKDAPDFRSELRGLLNKHNMESGSDTPDFILNEFLAEILMAFNRTVRAREKWYGREAKPSDIPTDPGQIVSAADKSCP